MTVQATIDAAEPRIELVSEFHHKDAIKTLPGAAWSSKDKSWKMPLSWSSCLALRATFQDQLVIHEDLARWAWNEKTTRVDPALALREIVDLSQPGTPDTPFVKEALRLQTDLKLFPHQAAGAAFMATAQQACIFDETGTGKSAQTIAAMRILHRLGHQVFPALVVVPNTIKKTWYREFAAWWPELEVQIISGGAAQRRKILETPAHVYIINWDTLHKHTRLASYGNMALKRCIECGGLDARITPAVCEVHKRELNYLMFNTVVADEVHSSKSPSSKRTRALWAASAGSQYRFALTGTPIQDTIVDLWPVLRFISPDEYSSKTRFVDRFAETGFNIWGAFMVMGVKESARAEYDATLNPRMRRMLKKIVLPFLPPVIQETRYIEMGPAQAKAYKQMQKETLAELETGTLVGMNPLSRATRLLQFASAYAEVSEKTLPDGRVESTVRVSNPSNKIHALMEDICEESFGQSSLVIFAQSRQLLDLLAIEMTAKSLKFGMITGAVSLDDRQQAIDDFQAGKIKYILVTIAAGGVGLTLTAADTMVFLQRAWSSVAMKQALSRAHRIGSERHDTIKVIDYVSENTVEEAQVLRLDGKFARIESIVRDQVLLAKLLAGEPLPDEIAETVDLTEFMEES